MALQVGDKAPLFDGQDESGNALSLEQFKGKKVVLYFYPKDNTPGCTAQSCNLRDNYALLTKRGYAVIGVSADSARKHQNFIKKFNLPFPLLVDTEKKVIESYGVWGPKKFMGREFEGIIRTTFIIDEQGMIEKIIDKVDTENHTEQILDAIEA